MGASIVSSAAGGLYFAFALALALALEDEELELLELLLELLLLLEPGIGTSSAPSGLGASYLASPLLLRFASADDTPAVPATRSA